MPYDRIEAAQAYIDALKGGDHALGRAAGKYLAKDIVVKVGNQKWQGAAEAERRVTGQWPQTNVLRRGDWSAAQPDGETVKFSANMPPFGAGVQAVNITFWFNQDGEIARVVQENINDSPLYEGEEMPDFVRERVNRALRDDIPLSVSYVNEQGRPSLSLRGSVLAYSPTQLALWARNREGLVKGIEQNPYMSLLYRENPTRSTLIFNGKARVVSDQAEAYRIHDMTPEVEQLHLTRESGAAVIIEVERVDGSTPEGRVRVRRNLD